MHAAICPHDVAVQPLVSDYGMYDPGALFVIRIHYEYAIRKHSGVLFQFTCVAQRAQILAA
jgi:hypothetical protein